jgi:hypothetical protein
VPRREILPQWNLSGEHGTIAEERMMDMRDFEHLLLSWTQLTAIQLVMGENAESSSLRMLEEKLYDDFQINEIRLVGRTLEEYAVAFRKNGENQMIRFDAEDVESIYDV